jgi:hypothetical protein
VKLFLPFAFALLTAIFATAQCSEFEITMLQAIQRAEPGQKDAKIQSFGFDPYSSQNGRRIFNKCWKGNVDGKTIYEQKIILEEKQNTYTFLTLNQEHFMRLRSAIEDRNGGIGKSEDPNIYVGRMFLYRFGMQSYDGHEYYKITISNK